MLYGFWLDRQPLLFFYFHFGPIIKSKTLVYIQLVIKKTKSYGLRSSLVLEKKK